MRATESPEMNKSPYNYSILLEIFSKDKAMDLHMEYKLQVTMNIMSYGLISAPSVFQGFVKKVLHEHLN